MLGNQSYLSKQNIWSENRRQISDLELLRQCLLCILECDLPLHRHQRFVLQPPNGVLLLFFRFVIVNTHWYIRFGALEAVTDFGSRTSLQSSVSSPIISSSGAELAPAKYLSIKSPISLFSSSKRFPKIDEFSSETSRFAMTMCRSCQTTQRVHLTRGTHQQRPLSAFWPISEHLTTKLWYNHQEYFYTWLLIGSLFVLCLHQTLLNCAFLLDDFRQLCH